MAMPPIVLVMPAQIGIAKNGGVSDIGADAVVIADGGLPGNAEPFGKYIGPLPDRVLMRHAGTVIGDGLRIAAEAGAALVGLDRFYGHLLSRDAMENKDLWPYPQIDAVATAAIVVDRRGYRDWAAFRSPMTHSALTISPPKGAGAC